MKRGDKVKVTRKGDEYNAYFYGYMGENKEFAMTTPNKVIEDEIPPQTISVHQTINVKRKAT